MPGMKCFLLALLIGGFAACSWAHAEDFSGRFVASGTGGTIKLTLDQDESGDVSGEMTDGFTLVNLEGKREGPEISGDATSDDGEELGFVATFEADGNLHLKIFPYDGSDNPYYSAAQTIIFARQSSVQVGRGAQTAGNAETAGNGVRTTTRAVYVNRVKIDAATSTALENQYAIPIQDARYWYDVICGAWGVEGGPTAGFIYPGLNLSGPTPVDIS